MTSAFPTQQEFSSLLFEKMKHINPAVADLELYEFRYCLDNITPKAGWAAVNPLPAREVEALVSSRAFYNSIQVKPQVDGQIVADERIVLLAHMLFVGLVTGAYSIEWTNHLFYFDVRSFFFLHRTEYFSKPVLDHLGGSPYRQFERKQKIFERFQGVGYRDFSSANAEVDALFIASIKKIIASRGTPHLLAIAGQTAAGKTEIVERLKNSFQHNGQKTTSIELDNFLTDRDEREARGVFSQGKEAFHFDLFKQSLEDILHGKKISIPHYDTILATSSHNKDGTLKPGRNPIVIEPADIIFIEGNFPFLIPEVVHLINTKVVYLTDDHVRMKRKWKRDIDYRKKYDSTYFCNRYFKEQFIMAEVAYRPQMEACDMVVDTTGAALWVTPEIATILEHD